MTGKTLYLKSARKAKHRLENEVEKALKAFIFATHGAFIPISASHSHMDLALTPFAPDSINEDALKEHKEITLSKMSRAIHAFEKEAGYRFKVKTFHIFYQHCESPDQGPPTAIESLNAVIELVKGNPS